MRQLVLDDGLFVLAGARQPPRAGEVHLRGPQLGAVERQVRIAIVGIFLQRARVFDDGAIVVGGELGLLAGLHRAGRGRAGAGHQRHGEDAGQAEGTAAGRALSGLR